MMTKRETFTWAIVMALLGALLVGACTLAGISVAHAQTGASASQAGGEDAQLVQAATQALASGNWRVLLVAAVLALVWATRRWGPTIAALIVVHGGRLAGLARRLRLDLFLAWTATDKGGAVMALAWSVLICAVNGALAGKGLLESSRAAIVTAFVSMGAYSGGKRLLPGYQPTSKAK